MKKYILSSLLLVGALSFSACDDFFDPETDDSLDGDKYMSSLTEMTTGYLGIMTKLQAVGDKAILLTDTRAELLEPTEQSINELIALYNYDDDLSGNSYADPSPYYDVVIACNDYISNILEFKADYPELVAETEYYEGLISSALRVKVWAYLTIAEIYGQALWFEDPILKIEDLTNTDKYELLSIEQVIDKCLGLLEQGYEGYAADVEFSWLAWVDPENITSIAESQYRYWDTMTPPYEGLLAKLYLWKAAFLNAQGVEADTYYEGVCSLLLPEFDMTFKSNKEWWQRCAYTTSRWKKFWDNADPHSSDNISSIIYDYTKSQTNSLLKHFSDEYPNKYLLRPSEAGMMRMSSDEYNPGFTVSSDARFSTTCKQNNSNWYVGKFRSVGSSVRPYPYQDDVHIYIFRAGEYLLMLMEALNHLERYVALDGMMNVGFLNHVDTLLAVETTPEAVSAETYREWNGFTSYWTNQTSDGGSISRPYSGFRGCWSLNNLEFKTDGSAESKQYNDSLLVNEYLLEMAVEGKTYPAMIRFATRWNDAEFISKRVSLKYGEKAAAIENKIVSNNPITGLPGYFVPWDLKIQ